MLREIAQGHKAARIAHDLDLDEETVRSHLARLYARIYATGQAHAIYRVHANWPYLLADLPPAPGAARYLSDVRRMLLWHVSQGEMVMKCGERYGLTMWSSKSQLRAAYQQLKAASAAQAVHNAYVLGLLRPPGEIR